MVLYISTHLGFDYVCSMWMPLQVERFTLFATNRCLAAYCKTEKPSLNSVCKENIKVSSKRVSVEVKLLSTVVILALGLAAISKCEVTSVKNTV